MGDQGIGNRESEQPKTHSSFRGRLAESEPGIHIALLVLKDPKWIARAIHGARLRISGCALRTTPGTTTKIADVGVRKSADPDLHASSFRRKPESIFMKSEATSKWIDSPRPCGSPFGPSASPMFATASAFAVGFIADEAGDAPE